MSDLADFKRVVHEPMVAERDRLREAIETHRNAACGHMAHDLTLYAALDPSAER
jgi:hypothetical protein